MNFRITYLHNILYIKKERKGKKKKKKGEKKKSDNMIKKIVNTYRQTSNHS